MPLSSDIFLPVFEGNFLDKALVNSGLLCLSFISSVDLQIHVPGVLARTKLGEGRCMLLRMYYLCGRDFKGGSKSLSLDFGGLLVPVPALLIEYRQIAQK